MISRIDSRHWKIFTGRHFQNGRHNTAQIQHCPIFNAISYVGRLWRPELIPDIEKFLPVAIFKMAATIPHKFNIVRFQRPEYYFVSHLICIFFLRSTYLGSFSLNLTKCSNSIQFNVLFKSHLSITGHTTQIKQSYNNKLESHSLQNYKRL